MEYNLKEQLFDKINGLKITDPNIKETWFNWGVKELSMMDLNGGNLKLSQQRKLKLYLFFT